MFVSPVVDQERLPTRLGAAFCATGRTRWRSISSWSQAGGHSRAQSEDAGECRRYVRAQA
jgi:hypothetical protein